MGCRAAVWGRAALIHDPWGEDEWKWGEVGDGWEFRHNRVERWGQKW